MSSVGGSVLNGSYRAFVQQGVSMLIASRDAANCPCACRAAGCRILDDGRLQVFVNRRNARHVLEAVSGSRTVAVVFSDPPTHQTIQVKGIDATVMPATDHAAALADYAGKFVAALTGLGYTEAMARALIATDLDETCAIVFTPTALFDQTPGPGAGAQVTTDL